MTLAKNSSLIFLILILDRSNLVKHAKELSNNTKIKIQLYLPLLSDKYIK